MALIQVDSDDYKKLKDQVAALISDRSKVDSEILKLTQLAEKLRLETGSFRQALVAPASGLTEERINIGNLAPLESPTFTGTVTVPTGVAAGTAINKAQLDAMPIGSVDYTDGSIIVTPSNFVPQSNRVMRFFRLANVTGGVASVRSPLVGNYLVYRMTFDTTTGALKDPAISIHPGNNVIVSLGAGLGITGIILRTN